MAVTTYNQNITAIFGGGNPDTGWAVDTGGGLQLGLRLKNRDNANTTNVGGVYNYATPLSSNPARAIYNWEFSVAVIGGSRATTLADTGYDFYVNYDLDNSVGTAFTPLNLALIPDNSFGTAGVTPNGTGVEGAYGTNGSLYNMMQNSENDAFFGVAITDLDATRTYELFAVASGAGPTGTRVASVTVIGVIGAGGATTVPDNGNTLAMLGIGAVLMGFVSRRRGTNNKR